MSDGAGWQTVIYQVAVEDIERAKRRAYQLAYYSAALFAGLFTLVGLFEQGDLASPYFYAAIIGVGAAIALSSSSMIAATLHSLGRFRAIIAEYDKLHFPDWVRDLRGKLGRLKLRKGSVSPENKFVRDLPFYVLLMLFPWGGVAFLVWYVLGRAGWLWF